MWTQLKKLKQKIDYLIAGPEMEANGMQKTTQKYRMNVGRY